MIEFLRSDDRLIHGQVQTKIIPMYGIDRVVAIDDNTAGNPALKRIFEMAAPQGVRATVSTFEDAKVYIEKAFLNSKKTLILARRPSTFVKVYEAFPEMPKELNVANIPHEDDSVQVALDIWIDHEQMEAIKKLDSLGVNIHFRLYPGMQGSSCYWKDVKDKYK
ncbi:MAG: PTS mannose/fructose/sorbose transporter subunit IIB [Erysipelotrichia bacterium]|nr:PTS mannose/fructose/sorbose transporter subunit IIB [Erysipelotrichia bacterium]